MSAYYFELCKQSVYIVILLVDIQMNESRNGFNDCF